ncbi:hypothetical protein IWZ03DRAFT_77820 [Phyllosticta citriasiana]|uniref:DUF1996 domain-containing protein n=1 Tax=Phyllosticta citriasiana TaxID=595635 RepID=A0ABR1K9D7_9PEZI
MKYHLASGALAALSLTGTANAFWRMPCRGRTALERVDPIVDPGKISSHAHSVQGSGAFAESVTFDELRASNCTSCQVTQDKSAYWVPSLHFMYPNGTTVIVQQDGGMLAYYLLYGDDPKAFPPGFRMLAGDPLQRNFTGLAVPDPAKPWTGKDVTQSALRLKALGFNCLHYSVNPPEGTLYRHFLPDKDFLDENCSDGLRLELMFPSCWNGKDLDSDDHKSHVAYPDQVITGDCPSGYETRLVSLLYEVIWNTQAFKGVDGQFVLSNGDPTGHGYHGDFITGWDENFLQSAINTCTSESGEIEDCPLFDIQSEADTQQCKAKVPEALADDNCEGPNDDGLCGGVQVQYGPAYATMGYSNSSATATGAPSYTGSTPLVPTLSYQTSQRSFASDKYGGGVTIMAVTGVTPAPSPTPVTTELVGTTTFTSAGAVYEVAIEEVDVYVTETATATAAAKHRRHLQRHHANRHEHGLLAQ